MKKKAMLEHWAGLEANQQLNPLPVAYKHEGSTYAEDGIRITGSEQWIDSVLSRVKDLLCDESGSTRLQVVYKQSTDRETREPIDSFNCYIQVHERGGEAQAVNRMIEGSAKRRGRQVNYLEML